MPRAHSPDPEHSQHGAASRLTPDAPQAAGRADPSAEAGAGNAAADVVRPGRVTQLLRSVSEGDRAAYDRVFALVYDELRRVAHQQLRGARDAEAVHTTELVHELYLKLLDRADVDWENRAHFYAIAARAMRQILVDLARTRKASKRGGAWERTTLTGKQVPSEIRLDEVLALDELLESLDERQRQIVEYRFYGGLSEDEIAQVLGVSTRTVQREWAKARAWLYRSLYPNQA
jgi:RNA polymerase sigma factor (TIGR02999 family)